MSDTIQIYPPPIWLPPILDYKPAMLPLTKININGTLFISSEGTFSFFNIYNLGPTPLGNISFHIEPSAFLDGLDDIENSLSWILTPYSDGHPKIAIRIENTMFLCSYNYQGASFDKPYIYQRSTDLSIKSIQLRGYGEITITPIYGSDETIFAKDWTEKINNRYHNPSKSPSDYVDESGYNKDNYIGDHLYNSQYFRKKDEDDKLIIGIYSYPTHPEYDQEKMNKACDNIILSFYYPLRGGFPDDFMYLDGRSYKLDKFLGI